jgi:hypothetical protein
MYVHIYVYTYMQIYIYIYIYVYIYMYIYIGRPKKGGPNINDPYPFFSYDHKEPLLNAQAVHLAIYFGCKEVLNDTCIYVFIYLFGCSIGKNVSPYTYKYIYIYIYI